MSYKDETMLEATNNGYGVDYINIIYSCMDGNQRYYDADHHASYL